MLRNDWGFDYSVEALLQAAKDSRGVREIKVAAWEKRRDEVMNKIRTSGIKVTETQLQQLYTGHDFNRVQIDPQMQADLLECQAKITEHQKAGKEYDRWALVLEAEEPTRELRLNMDDHQFFFGDTLRKVV